MNNDNTFHYTYSAKQQEEIAHIRKKYLPQEEDKMETLRRLDRSVYQKAQIWSITLGVIGTLILGTGMSLILTELGNLLGVYAMAVGVTVGLVGLVMIAFGYPLYNHIVKIERQRIAPEILRLTDELMK